MADVNAIILCSVTAALGLNKSEVPAGGNLVVSCESDPECTASSSSATLTNLNTGADLDFTVVQTGSLSADHGWAVLRPSVPLVVGDRVEAHLEWGFELAFNVVPADAAQAEARHVATTLQHEGTPTSEVVCCSKHGGCGGTSCASKREHVRVELEVGLIGPPAGASQWLYQVSFSAEGDTTFESEPLPWFEPVRHEFEVDVPDYCYALFAQPLLGGERVEIDRRCITNSSNSPLGEQETTEKLARTLHMCDEPPEGWLNEWCDTWIECADNPWWTNCKRPLELCDWSDGDGGLVDAGSASPSTPRAGHGFCSTSSPDMTGSRTPLSAWFALLFAGFVRRRRAREDR
jgi:MYXO-CTERM domain-containing protein